MTVCDGGRVGVWGGRTGAHLAVGTEVEDDGQALVRLDAGQGRVEGQLADGDAHAVGAQVAQAQNALAVRHHDGAHVVLRPAREFYYSRRIQR